MIFFFSGFAEGGNGSPKASSLTPYEEALDALSSLIIRRTRADSSNMGDQFDHLFEYLKVKNFENLVALLGLLRLTMVCNSNRC